MPANANAPTRKSNRGLASADEKTREAVARKGGQAVSRNRQHMAEIGRKGGEAVSRNREHMAEIGRKGGEAVSQDRQHMAEIGREGGEASHSRHSPSSSSNERSSERMMESDRSDSESSRG